MTSLSSFLLLLIPILLTVFLLLFSPISSFYHPPYSPRVSLQSFFSKKMMGFSDNRITNILCLCRACYMKTKQGWVQFHQAVTTNATSVILAWPFRSQLCLCLESKLPWRFFTMTHLH